jgi:hypothetical protein
MLTRLRAKASTKKGIEAERNEFGFGLAFGALTQIERQIEVIERGRMHLRQLCQLNYDKATTAREKKSWEKIMNSAGGQIKK